MPNETKQPFTGREPRSSADTELVAGVFDDSVAAEMTELTGDQPTKADDEPTELEMSAAEQGATTEVEGSVSEFRKKEYITWFKEFDRDSVWVECSFVFNDDGTVEAKGNLSLAHFGVKEFPPKLVRVNGLLIMDNNELTNLDGFPEEVSDSIYMSSNKINSLVGLPDIIREDLDIHGNELTSLDGMPSTIGGSLNISGNYELGQHDPETVLEGLPKTINNHLNLVDIKATRIPAGLTIGGKVIIRRTQRGLIDDCRAKGYNLDVH